ncbi:MAG: hypothetical protein IT308_03300 [Anaerolineaceae bacterium]|nr:hypothetical protein [Anaerolineaceae bacterium]
MHSKLRMFSSAGKPLKNWLQLILCAFIGTSATLVLAACNNGFDPFTLIFTPTLTRTVTPSATASPSVTWTATATQTPSPPPTETETKTPSPTSTFTEVPTETLTITAGPSPTNTRTATRTRRPTLTPTLTLTRTPSLTPTITNTPTPPFAMLRLQRPGPLSKVVSPIQVTAMITPGDDGYVYIDLIGEDNRIITREQLDYRRLTGKTFLIAPLLEFKISAAVEAARVVLYTYDRFGRLKALTSVDVLLLSVGDAEIYPFIELQSPYLVRYPNKGQVLQGGSFPVIGLARPVNNTPLILEAIDETGERVGTVETQVPQPSGDLSHTPFEVSLPYTVSGQTPVLLTLRQESNSRIPGTVSLTSMEIVLEP